jgi:hypothetical protein
MAFIFVPLETISYTFRAVSLGVRLWVNMLAGHTLLHILTGEPGRPHLPLPPACALSSAASRTQPTHAGHSAARQPGRGLESVRHATRESGPSRRPLTACLAAGMALALPFSLSFLAMLPATFGVACLLSALVSPPRAAAHDSPPQPWRRRHSSRRAHRAGRLPTVARQHIRALPQPPAAAAASPACHTTSFRCLSLPAHHLLRFLAPVQVGLEYLVAVLQSGVFSILSTVYVGEFNSVKLAGPLAKIVKKI